MMVDMAIKILGARSWRDKRNIKSTKERLGWLALGGLLLMSGLLFYLEFRSIQPLAWSWIKLSHTPGRIVSSIRSSYPSFCHTAGFSCLSFALGPLTLKSMIRITTFWFGANAIWELKSGTIIESAAPLLGYTKGDIGATLDLNDILGSALGAGLPFLLYLLRNYCIGKPNVH